MKQYAGKTVRVITQNTEYTFEFPHDGGLPTGIARRLNDLGPARYMDIPTVDVEIKGTKKTRYPWGALPDGARAEGQILKGGFLYFRYPGHEDYITTSQIQNVIAN